MCKDYITVNLTEALKVKLVFTCYCIDAKSEVILIQVLQKGRHFDTNRVACVHSQIVACVHNLYQLVLIFTLTQTKVGVD